MNRLDGLFSEVRACGIRRASSTLGWACGDCWKCPDRPQGRLNLTAEVGQKQPDGPSSTVRKSTQVDF